MSKKWIREALRKTLDDHEKGNGGKNDEGESPRTEEGEDEASNTSGKVLNEHSRSQRWCHSDFVGFSRIEISVFFSIAKNRSGYLENFAINPPAPTELSADEPSVVVCMSNHVRSFWDTATYMAFRRAIALVSPIHIQRQDVRLPSASAPTPSPMSWRAARPTSRSNASLAACGGLGVIGKLANASNAWPTTKVMKGATPPAIIEAKIAGRRRMRRWRREIKEKRRRIEGVIVGEDMGDAFEWVVCLSSLDSMEDRGESWYRS